MTLRKKGDYILIIIFQLLGDLLAGFYLSESTTVYWIFPVLLMLIPPLLMFVSLLWNQYEDKIDKLSSEYQFIGTDSNGYRVYGYHTKSNVLPNLVLLSAYGMDGYLKWTSRVNVDMMPFASILLEQNKKNHKEEF